MGWTIWQRCYVHIDFLPFTKSKHRPISIWIPLQAFDVMEYTVRLGGINFSMGDVRGMNLYRKAMGVGWMITSPSSLLRDCEQQNIKKTPQRLDWWYFDADLLWFEPSIECRSRSHKYDIRHGEVEGIKKPMIFAFEAARLRRKKALGDGDGCVATLVTPLRDLYFALPVFVGFYVIIHHWKSPWKDLKGSLSSSSVWDSTALFLLSNFWPTKSESNQLVFLNVLHLMTWQGSSKMTNPNNNFTGNPSKLPCKHCLICPVSGPLTNESLGFSHPNWFRHLFRSLIRTCI